MSRIEHSPIVESPAPGPGPLRLSQWHAACEASSAALAQRLAAAPAIGQALITLRGELGAGKTTLARYLLRALGVPGRIKSPSYAIVETYRVEPQPRWPQGLEVLHADFYRFRDAREWEDSGLRELFAAPGLKLVEWPDKAAPCLPKPDFELELRFVDPVPAADAASEPALEPAASASGTDQGESAPQIEGDQTAARLIVLRAWSACGLALLEHLNAAVDAASAPAITPATTPNT